MIELLLKIDCKKTEKALLAVCKMSDKTPDELIRDWLALNQSLIDIAEVTKRDPELKKNVITLCGEDVLNDLLGVLK